MIMRAVDLGGAKSDKGSGAVRTHGVIYWDMYEVRDQSKYPRLSQRF